MAEVDAAVNPVEETSRTFTQEVQIASPPGGRVEWVAGFYYLHETASQDAIVILPLLMASNQTQGKVDTNAWAIFGHMSYALNKHWCLTAGLRYRVETKRLSFRQTISDALGLLTGMAETVTFPDQDKETWDAVTPFPSLSMRRRRRSKELMLS